jgi:hypothetical protein
MIVDGVTERWCLITLLDTVLAFYASKDKSKQDCDRRKFDQYEALKQSIAAAVRMDDDVHVDLTSLPPLVSSVCNKVSEDHGTMAIDNNKGPPVSVSSFASAVTNESSAASSDLSITGWSVRVIDIESPWDSVLTLRKALIGKAMSKSWSKRDKCVGYLCELLSKRYDSSQPLPTAVTVTTTTTAIVTVSTMTTMTTASTTMGTITKGNDGHVVGNGELQGNYDGDKDGNGCHGNGSDNGKIKVTESCKDKTATESLSSSLTSTSDSTLNSTSNSTSTASIAAVTEAFPHTSPDDITDVLTHVATRILQKLEVTLNKKTLVL